MIASLLIAGSFASAADVVRVQHVMGTLCEISARGPRATEAVTAAFAELNRWDRLLSLYKEDSEASAFNRSDGNWFACSESFWEALTLSLRLAGETGGAFDPTVLPAVRKGKAGLPAVGYAKVELDPARRAARFRSPGAAIDFGAIGKGLALDHAGRVLREAGVEEALLNFGGQILAVGSWEVALDGSRRGLRLRDASISTSGNAERPGHIVSPLTGEPIREARSTSVIAPTAAEADAWSTAAFVRGPGNPSYPGCVIHLGARSETSAACRDHFATQDSKGGR